jgi:hypothetical protein
MLSERGVGRRTCLSTGNDRGSRVRSRTEPSLGQIQSFRAVVKIVPGGLFSRKMPPSRINSPDSDSESALELTAFQDFFITLGRDLRFVDGGCNNPGTTNLETSGCTARQRTRSMNSIRNSTAAVDEFKPDATHKSCEVFFGSWNF